MCKIKDLVGKKFGRLTVIKKAGSSKDNRALWECQCDCGNIDIYVGKQLRNGHTKSCGCLKKEVAAHNREIGHWLDTGSGAGAITRAFVHFN